MDNQLSFYSNSYIGLKISPPPVIREGNGEYGKHEIRNSEGVCNLVKRIIDSPKEIALAVFLNAGNKVLGVEEVSVGIATSSILHPRECFRSAISLNASSVIFVHNHPSGNTEPSKEDITITKRLVKCGVILGIKVLDHIIVGSGGNYLSMGDSNKVRFC